MEHFESTPTILNRKLDLIRKTSPKKTPEELNSIYNSFDRSVGDLGERFRYLKDISSPPRSYYSPYIPNKPQYLNNSLSFAQTNQKISSQITVSNLLKRINFLEEKLKEKDNRIYQFEGVCKKFCETIEKLKNENDRLKTRLAVFEEFSSKKKEKPKKEILTTLKDQIEQISRDQNECYRKLNELSKLSTSRENEKESINVIREGDQWKELRRINEEMHRLAQENKSIKERSQIQINELKLQIDKLENSLEIYYPTKISNYSSNYMSI